MAVKFFTLLFLIKLAGCAFIPDILYKIDVQQGNVVTDEMLEKLKPDMTKSQVRFVMGTPLVMDPFRDNRWDYVYVQREKGDLVEHKRLTIYFKDNQLLEIENELLYSIESLDDQETTAAEFEPADESEKTKVTPEKANNDMKNQLEGTSKNSAFEIRQSERKNVDEADD